METPSLPVELSESASTRVEVGAQVADLMAHPGWAHLKKGVRVWQDATTAGLMGISGSDSAATYADRTGELKGLANVERIARGIVEAGEQAKAQAREAEIEEES